ncbi:MAG: hypothetical protein R6V05_09260 [Candidatus Brocadiia bacterium]
MAEGPVVHRYASRLEDALGGSVVQVEFGVSKLKPMEADFDGVRLDGRITYACPSCQSLDGRDEADA